MPAWPGCGCGSCPETRLRQMARALAEARPLWRLRVSAASIQAVAHAFAMPGLVSAEDAGAAAAQASRALGLQGAACPGLDPSRRRSRTDSMRARQHISWSA